MTYILVKAHETIEVMEGREERRDQLIRAGYVWVNEPHDITDALQRSNDDAPRDMRPLRKDRS